MAGKLNKGKNKKGSNAPANSTQQPTSLDSPANDTQNAVEPSNAEVDGVAPTGDSTSTEPEVKAVEAPNSANPARQGSYFD